MYGPRRRRLSRWWWLALIAVVVVGTSLLVNDRGMEARRQAAFLDSARILTNETGQVGAGFNRLVGIGLLTITRTDFGALMDRLASQMVQHVEVLVEVDTPESARLPRELLELAFGSWSAGLEQFRTAIGDVADDPTGTEPVDRLGEAIVQLRVGDHFYDVFVERAGAMAADLDVAIGEFRSISFIGDRPELSSAEALARIVRDNAEIGIRRDVAILQVVFEPLASGGVGDGGEIIFPATEHLWFSAVIRNLGSVDQKGLVVTVEVRNDSGETVAIEKSSTQDLAAEETGTVELEPVSVQPGAGYVIIFNLTRVDDEVNFDDNVWESAIRINPPG